MNLPESSIGRPASLPTAGRALSLPCFFPSVSSIKTNLAPAEYVRILCAVGHPQFLMSAFDIHRSSAADRRQLLDLARKAGSQGTSVLLDSGNYERFWMRDDTWIPESFWSVLKDACFPLAFSYDQYVPDGEGKGIVDTIEKASLLDEAQCASTSIIPIVHARPEQLPDLVAHVVARLQPLMVAVAERELGEGLLARAACVLAIRKALGSSTPCPLHLLGTGNPLSILIYSLCGADSFDGLEWCQTAVDHETALLYHFQQREFSRTQPSLSGLENLPYAYVTMVRNLVFYERWMACIRRALKGGSALELISQYLPKHIIEPVQELLSGGPVHELR